MRRVAITGLGCVTAVGLSTPETWDAAKEGRSGIGVMDLGEDRPMRSKVAAQIRNFDPKDHLPAESVSHQDPFSQYAVVAAREAAAQAGLTIDGELAEQTGVVMGTGIGGATTIDGNSRRLYEQGNTRVHPASIPRLMPSAAASNISMTFGTTGPAFAVTSACASATHALGEAFWMVRTGRAQIAFAGGSEATLVWGSLPGWWALRVMDPENCRPFCQERQGFVLGEGAGVLMLEDWDFAQSRGANILAELAGFGMSADGDSMLEPSAEGAAKAMRAALADAGTDPTGIDYVNAHGTGTRANDVNESRAIRMVFGDHADQLAVTSTKAVHGHALGGTGAIEAVLTAEALRHGIIPPTANFGTPDPECDLDYVPNEARSAPLRAAISNSFAFGGLNAVIVLKAVP